MTKEEAIEFLNVKTEAANTLFDQIKALEVNEVNKTTIQGLMAQLSTVIDEAKAVYDEHVKDVWKHGFCITRTRITLPINKIKKALDQLP